MTYTDAQSRTITTTNQMRDKNGNLINEQKSSKTLPARNTGGANAGHRSWRNNNGNNGGQNQFGNNNRRRNSSGNNDPNAGNNNNGPQQQFRGGGFSFGGNGTGLTIKIP